MPHTSDNYKTLSSYSYNNTSRYSIDYYNYDYYNLSSLEAEDCGSVPDFERIKVRYSMHK